MGVGPAGSWEASGRFGALPPRRVGVLEGCGQRRAAPTRVLTGALWWTGLGGGPGRSWGPEGQPLGEGVRWILGSLEALVGGGQADKGRPRPLLGWLAAWAPFRILPPARPRGPPPARPWPCPRPPVLKLSCLRRTRARWGAGARGLPTPCSGAVGLSRLLCWAPPNLRGLDRPPRLDAPPKAGREVPGSLRCRPVLYL